MEDRCLICGAVIPEGRQICPVCEGKHKKPMTDVERVKARLTRLIKAAHNDNYDFVYIPVGTAKLIIKLLEEAEVRE